MSIEERKGCEFSCQKACVFLFFYFFIFICLFVLGELGCLF